MGIGLTLGSGGARGLASIGVIKVLEEKNIEIDELTGSSIGAAIAAYYAVHGEITGLEKKVLSMTKTDFLKLIDFNKLKRSIIKGHKIRIFMQQTIGEHKFSDLKIPLKIISTNILEGESIVFEEGDLLEAVMSSISLPGIFPPMKKEDMMLLDGGILAPTPVSYLSTRAKVGVDFTIRHEKPQTIDTFNAISLSFTLLRTNGLEGRTDENTVILRPNTGLELNGLLRFDHAAQFIAAGEREAREKMDLIKELIR